MLSHVPKLKSNIPGTFKCVRIITFGNNFVHVNVATCAFQNLTCFFLSSYFTVDDSRNTFEYDIETDLDDSDSEDCGLAKEDKTVSITREELAEWAVKHTITRSALDELLVILKKIVPSLPKDGRTLKQTPRDAPLTFIEGGEYVHYGLKESLTDFFFSSAYESDSVDLNINVDGLPVAKSSLAQAWPILINVNGTNLVYSVGFYCGRSKPKDVNEFLIPFVNELLEVIDENFTYNNKTYKVNCRAIICDAPARALIMGIKGHTGYSCCHKCTQKGEYKNNRVVFKLENNTLRTDENFRTRYNKSYHNICSPMTIEKLPIDMVNSFPLDYMHVVCLGVVKTLVHAWIRVRKEQFSLDTVKKTKIKEELENLEGQLPVEFCRPPRDIDEFERYKATEFRQFLLYTGPFVLKDILNEDIYKHFLTLSLAIRILLDTKLCKSHNDCANALLRDFVRKIPNLYNETLLVYNFHCLTHLAGDCLLYGSLETFGAFKFENKLGNLKRLIKKKDNVTVQLYNRIVEQSINTTNSQNLPKTPKISKTFIKTENVYLSTLPPNNFYRVGNEIFQVSTINPREITNVYGYKVMNLNSLFHLPIESSLLNIWQAEELIVSETTHKHSIKDVTKMVSLRNKNNVIAFFPVIHDDRSKW